MSRSVCCFVIVQGKYLRPHSARLATMRVRPATKADRQQLMGLIEGYFDFYRTPFPAANIEALLDTLQADERLGIQLVAEDDTQLIGFASLYAGIDTLVAGRI